MSELINEIPADTEIEMTGELIRAFKVAGCHPTCHCCGKELIEGQPFKLAYIKSLDRFTVTYHTDERHKEFKEEDEMLCNKCSPADLIAYQEKLWKNSEVEFDNRHSGYTRHHQIDGV